MYTPEFPWLGALNSFALLDSSLDAMLTEAHPEMKSALATAAIVVNFLMLMFGKFNVG